MAGLLDHKGAQVVEEEFIAGGDWRGEPNSLEMVASIPDAYDSIPNTYIYDSNSPWRVY